MTQAQYEAETAKTFDGARKFHAIAGKVIPCGWETYRAEAPRLYGAVPEVLDSMLRLGHFDTIGGKTVVFIG